MNKCRNCDKTFDNDITEYFVYLPSSTVAQSCCCEACAKELVVKERKKIVDKLNKFDDETKIYKSSLIDLNIKGEQ